MTQEDLFYKRIKARLMEKGNADSVAQSVASSVRVDQVANGAVFVSFADTFHGDLVVSDKTAVERIAHDIWGPEFQVFFKSEDRRSPRRGSRRRVTGSESSETGKVGTGAVRKAISVPLFSAEPSAQGNALVTLPTAQARAHAPKPEAHAKAEDPPARTQAVLGPAENARAIGADPYDRSAARADLPRDHEGATELIPELQFATFVRGDSNNLAFIACSQVASNPGKLNNPLVIYGATGLGKTHLLHAVGQEIKRNNPSFAVRYVTTTNYMTELIAAIRHSTQDEFKRKYNKVDVLLVDDIQFLEKKDSTQLEFFNTFNELAQNKKQIVITSDKYPKDIPNIEDRLRSRFLQGLIADIEPPSFEDRVAIIEAKAKMMHLSLPSEVVEHIATHVKSNVREIQGVLNQIFMDHKLAGKSASMESVNIHLRKIIRAQPRAVDLSSIQKIVANHFGVKLTELLSTSRQQKFVYPRHLAMYLAREVLGLAHMEIAASFGKKDHTTVLHAIDRISNQLESDASTKAVIAELRRKLDQQQN